MSTHLVEVSNIVTPRRRSAPEPIFSGYSRRRINDGILSHTGLSSIPSGSFEIKLHGSCPRCHHWHDKFLVRLSRRSQAYTRVSCQHCSRPMFGLGGNSTRTSLLSQYTRTGSNLSQLSASIVCVSRRPTMPNVPEDRSAGESHITALRTDSARPSGVHSETGDDNAQHSLTGGFQTANSSEAGPPSLRMPQRAPAPADFEATTISLLPPQRSMRKRMKSFFKRFGSRVSNHYKRKSSPSDGDAALERRSQAVYNAGGIRNTHYNPFEGQPTANEQTNSVHGEVTPDAVQHPAHSTAANIPSSAGDAPDIPVANHDPQSPPTSEYDNNHESRAERIRNIRRQKTEAARRRRMCECSSSCPCKQTCSSDHVHPSLNLSEIPDNPHAEDGLLYRPSTPPNPHLSSLEFALFGGHLSDSPRSAEFISSDINEILGDAYTSNLRTESRQSSDTFVSQGTTLLSSESTSSDRRSPLPPQLSSSSLLSQVARHSRSLASLSRINTQTQITESAPRPVQDNSSIEGERTPTQRDHGDNGLDGERTPTQDHHVGTRDLSVDTRDHSVGMQDPSTDTRDHHPLDMQDHPFDGINDQH